MKLVQNAEDQDARVLPFRRPDRDDVRRGEAPGVPPLVDAPAAGLERYERPDGAEDDDYRHRMLVNAGALVICTLLGAAGIWVAINIADLRRNQDCVLAGRKNCAELSIPSGPVLTGEEQAAQKRLPVK